ncbi:MAG: cytochrome c [Acidobacteria bacterium]|nr:cytochrome c [Acidobacteriota bacterium]
MTPNRREKGGGFISSAGAAMASVLVILSASFSAGAQERGREKRQAARAVARGQELFLRYCSPCHGPAGKGDGRFFATSLNPKPTDLSHESHLRPRTDAELFRWIGEGSGPAGSSLLCPPWGNTLEEEQIRALVAFIRTLAPAATRGPAPLGGVPARRPPG